MSKMEKQRLERKDLKKFGTAMGLGFLVITVIFSLKQSKIILPTAVISLAFFIFSVLAPVVLKPLYVIWMRFAHLLAWVNTRIILTAIFYLVFTPIGLLMKLFGKDLLDRKIEKQKTSYWHRKGKGEFNALSYERQF